MTHAWHDTYRHGHTPAHHLDPRSKLVAGLLFVLSVLLTRRLAAWQIAGYAGLLLTTACLARLSLGALVRRLATILPFALLMLASAAVSRLSYDHFRQVIAKALLSLGAMTLVSMTTPFPDFLRALEQCRVPEPMVLFLSFLYRYAAVLRREAIQLERGWSARYFGRAWVRQWDRLGHIVAALLIRSFERAERVYNAMLARGFSAKSGLVHLLHFSIWDAVFLATSGALLALIRWARP